MKCELCVLDATCKFEDMPESICPHFKGLDCIRCKHEDDCSDTDKEDMDACEKFMYKGEE